MYVHKFLFRQCRCLTCRYTNPLPFENMDVDVVLGLVFLSNALCGHWPGVRPCLITYNTAMDACVHGGAMLRAMGLAKELSLHRLKPDPTTFAILLVMTYFFAKLIICKKHLFLYRLFFQADPIWCDSDIRLLPN